MAKLRVHAFTISLDGYGAGPDQSRENPLGVGGEELHEWMFPTRTFQQMQGKEGGTTGVDDELTRRGFENIGAWIMGRNMFAPSRGPWPDDGWKGWWGDNPPYHGPVFVLTHHPQAPIPMEGGTTFYFVTEHGQTARRDPWADEIERRAVEPDDEQAGHSEPVRVDSDRLYTIVSGEKVRDAILELRFSPGVNAYAFTFG